MKLHRTNIFLFSTCFVLFCIGVHHCIAQNEISNLSFERISQKQRLAGSVVQDIFQDKKGFLWIATNNGLSRYDGLSFKNYTQVGPGGITDKIVTGLAEDVDGSIWFGTENGLNRLIPSTNRIEQYYEGTGPGTIPYRWCYKVFRDRQNTLWLATEKGLASYNRNTNSFENTPISLNGKDARINKFIKDIFEDSKGRLWLATSYGIKQFDRKTKTYQSYHREEPAGERLTENIFNVIAEDSEGNIYALSPYVGLYRFNASQNKFEKTGLSGEQLKAFELTDFFILNRQGKEYFVFTAFTGCLFADVHHALSPATAKGAMVSKMLPDVFATCIFYDRNGNLWVGSEKGLYRSASNSFAFHWKPIENIIATDNSIYHIIPDVRDPQNVFYLSTNNGWCRYHHPTGTLTKLQLPAAGSRMLHYINAWVSDKHGYWFSSIQGLGYYNLAQNKVTDYTHLVLDASGQKTTGFIVKDTAGRLWITVKRNGILVYNPATQKSQLLFGDKSSADNTYGESIKDLKIGPDGNIYFTAFDKLYKVSASDFSYQTFAIPPPEKNLNPQKTRPEKILFTPGGKILVSSRHYMYAFINGKLINKAADQSVLPYSIRNIDKGDGATLWIRAEEGLFKTDTAFSKWVSYNEIISSDDRVDIIDVYPGKPGIVLFTENGRLGILNEALLQQPVVPDAVLISRLKTGETESFFATGNQHEARYKDVVEIELAATGFFADKETKVLYMLDGWDNNWKELGNNPNIRYEQLPPGHYRFITKAVNSSGMESAETTVSFRIRPPFYFTWWFIALMVVLIASIIIMLYRYRLQKALQLERMRTRIATDLHDDIGATLSSISMYSEAIKNQLKGENPQLENVLNKMGENSREMVTSMSDIVWAINPKNDNAEKLTQRMENYARDVCAVKNVKLNFSADLKQFETKLLLEQRKNIYLVFKESLNNALKYANASQITVRIAYMNEKIELMVKDDGKGFNPRLISTGNGLRNMQLRAEEIQAELDIASSLQQGTTIQLRCPV